LFTFEYGVDCKKCSEGLGFNHFYVKSPSNPLIEDYTKIFYMAHENYISSVQCKMCLREPECMRKVDELSFMIIDFYVPALIQRLNNTETSMQLSENITLFAVCRIYTGVIRKRPR
jgi:hypothetical protein